MQFQSSDLIAVYAAIVATGALVLEVRRWFEAGPKLVIRVSPEAVRLTIGGSETEKHQIAMVSVYNRGGSPTTLTSIMILKYNTPFHRLLGDPEASYFIPNPSMDPKNPGMPTELNPGQKWQAYISKERDDAVGNLVSGKHYAEIMATHRDRPYIVRIRPPKKSRRKHTAGAIEMSLDKTSGS